MATRFAIPTATAAAWQDRFCELATSGLVRLPISAPSTVPEERVADDFAEHLAAGPDGEPVDPGAAARLARLFAAGKRVTLGLGRPAARDHPAAHGALMLERAAAAVAAEGAPFSPAAVSLDAEIATDADVASALAAGTARPDVFVMLSPDLLEAVQRNGELAGHDGQAYGARSCWDRLLELASVERRVHLVPRESAAPTDPAFAWHAMAAPEPGLAQPVTAGGVRVRLDVDLPRLVQLTERRPANIARICDRLVRLGDLLIDAAAWPLAQHRVHARSRRRLAIHLRELGETAVMLGGSPGSLGNLRRLGELLDLIGRSMRRTSRQLAAEARLPATGAGPNDPQLRHSHLLVWRPWDFLPASADGRDRQERFSRLFPLLRLADCAAWRRRGMEDPLTYGRMLRLAWASWRLR